NYQTADQLRHALTQSGKHVIPDTMDSDVVSQIADGIKKGFDVYKDVAAYASITPAKMPTPEEHTILMRKRAQFSSSCGEDLKDLGNKILDGAKWALGEVTKLGEGAWRVMVTVAGKAIKFTIDSAKKAWQFISK
ncbi:hypothetical protein F66182_18641, partial [Fusarium sp. NRRL 66182]